jgi:hypothetical protein
MKDIRPLICIQITNFYRYKSNLKYPQIYAKMPIKAILENNSINNHKVCFVCFKLHTFIIVKLKVNINSMCLQPNKQAYVRIDIYFNSLPIVENVPFNKQHTNHTDNSL